MSGYDSDSDMPFTVRYLYDPEYTEKELLQRKVEPEMYKENWIQH